MKELSLEKMENIEGGTWQDCVIFAAGFISMFGGPLTGIAGLMGMAASAGGCEETIM